jgi:hypothetical protein
MSESYARPEDIHGRFDVEWLASPSNDRGRDIGWPDLRPAERCDGENPMTGRACIQGHHKGYHRDATGAEWLDD